MAAWKNVYERVAGVPVSRRTDADEIVAGANALTAAWASVQGPENTALSGLGCWVLLSLLANGATGPARSELEAAVGLPAHRGLEGAVAMLELLETMPSVRAALVIWSRVVLDPEWVDGLPTGLVGQLTDQPAEDQRIIDRWVDEVTGGELSELPINISERTLLLLVSVLTLRVDWVEPFAEAGVFTEGTWAGGAATRLVQWTSDLDRLRVAPSEVGPLTLMQVPAHPGIDVHLVRGEHGAPPGRVLAAGIESLTGTRWPTGREFEDGTAAPGVHVETVDAHDPGDRMQVTTCAFDIRASHDLLARKQLFGLGAATDDLRGHFPGISPMPLAVDDARQDVVATFNRTGFRATAVTAVSMGVGSARPAPSETYRVKRVRVSFDEPFGFLVSHRDSSLVLVVGWVQDPAATRGEQPGQGSTHAPARDQPRLGG